MPSIIGLQARSHTILANMGGFGAVWNFIKRHKRKFVFAGTVVTGVYLTWKYAAAKLEEYKDYQMTMAFTTARKQTHFESNQKTCNATVYSLMPGLREALMAELNCEKLTEQLQLKPTNKVYLWSELKVLSFTRTLVAIYSTSILILTLRIQLNVIGGCIYARNKSRTDLPLGEEECDVQQRYLQTIQFFLSTGVRDLSSLVRHSVEKELMNVSLKKSFTIDSLLEMTNTVRETIERKSERLRETPFLPFISQMTPEPSSELDEKLNLARLINDTSDILKSEDYHLVLQATIDHGFSQLFTHLNRACSTITSDPRAMYGRYPAEGIPTGFAFAKVIPPLVGTIHVTCSDTITDYLQRLLTLQCIDDLAYQIYDSFGEPVMPS